MGWREQHGRGSEGSSGEELGGGVGCLAVMGVGAFPNPGLGLPSHGAQTAGGSQGLPVAC